MVTHQLELVRVFRDGPRYWVGLVRRGEDQLVLKLVLDDTPWVSPGSDQRFRPSDQLRTEIEVVKALGEHRSKIKGRVTALAGFSIDHEPWMLRQDLGTENVADNDSPLVFRPEFFAGEAGRSVLEFIASYQLVTTELRGSVERSPHTAQTTLEARMVIANLEQPIEPLAPYAARISDFLAERRDLHDSRRDTLAHTQVFPVHIFVSPQGEVGLIDWENACLSNALHDFMSLWIRGLAHPDWQRGLELWLAQRQRVRTDDDRELWLVERLLHAVGALNYAYWSHHESPAVRQRAIDLLTRCIRTTLA